MPLILFLQRIYLMLYSLHLKPSSKRLHYYLIYLLLFTTTSSLKAETHIAETYIKVGSSVIDISFAPNATNSDLSVTQQQVINWINKASHAVDDYFDGFPVSRLNIAVNSSTQSKVNGTAYSGETPTIILHIGKRTTLGDLQRDWVLVHELVHLAFPPVRSKHHWIEEGLATYIEPIVRVKAGLMSEENAWEWLITGTPKGLPEYGDQGLDNTHTWGRTYWGGALYFFLADMQIRQQTDNKSSLQDALKAIKMAGGTMQQRGTWPITKALTIGDKATKTHVLSNLYNQMKNNAVNTNLDKIWQRLGVSLKNNRIIFDNNAVDVKLRKSLISR